MSHIGISGFWQIPEHFGLFLLTPQMVFGKMLTKFYLYIGETEYELQPDDLRNWEEIRCSYKRANYDGVVRSFTSQFEFANNAMELLREAYLKDRYDAVAFISVRTSDNRWRFVERFRCPLDFSTISWESFTLRISSVDNSLAALINANKSTKYELTVGSDVPVAGNVMISRIPMKENLTYSFTQGTSYENSEDIKVSFQPDELPWVGNKGSEIAINQTIDWRDDQSNDSGSYILRAVKDVSVSFSYFMQYRSNMTSGSVSFRLRVKRGGVVLPMSGGAGCGCGSAQASAKYNFGVYSSVEALPDISSPVWSDGTHTTDLRYKGYAVVNGIVWVSTYIGWKFEWMNSSKTVDEYFTETCQGCATLNLLAGDVVFMEHELPLNSVATVRFKTSEFVFEWFAVGEDTYVEACSPKNVARGILQKIVGKSLNIHVDISGHDPRLADTFIMAAESVRALPEAKLYTSFSEFCGWMSAVFGYVYYIGDPTPARYSKKQFFGKIIGTPYNPAGYYAGVVNTHNIYYNSYRRCFFYAAEDGYYANWSTAALYNDPATGMPRTDTVFFEQNAGNKSWVFPGYSGSGDLNPIEYDIDDDMVGSDDQAVHFVHRSELLNPSAPVRSFRQCRNAKYDVDASSIYSSVTAGYDKKDYACVNGRDEFNFSNTYSTGCTVSDKTLSLISKYRADCYGIEFAIQKRTEDTTDTSSDKDVFFVLCSREGNQLSIDRTCEIENCLTDAVFNGAFSPMACIRANAGLICLQAGEMVLKFASSTGNSSIVIDGEGMSDDITLDTPLATCSTVEFTTDEIDEIADVDDLIEVVDEEGIKYRGFLKEVDIRYVWTEAAKYKLIVKDIDYEN